MQQMFARGMAEPDRPSGVTSFVPVERVPIRLMHGLPTVRVKAGLKVADALDRRSIRYAPGRATVNGRAPLLIGLALAEKIDGRSDPHASVLDRSGDTIRVRIPEADLVETLGLDPVGIDPDDPPELQLLAAPANHQLAFAVPDAVTIDVEQESWDNGSE